VKSHLFRIAEQVGEGGIMTLEEMKNVDISTVDPADLVDMHNFVVDMDLPKLIRMQALVKAAKNPYCFLSGHIVVKVSYADTNVTAEELVVDHMRTL
jgi:hypothetical protein